MNATTLPDNYQKNVLIMRENLKRGLEPARAIQAIDGMRGQFKRAGLYGETEKNFVNAMLAEVQKYTHMTIVLEDV